MTDSPAERRRNDKIRHISRDKFLLIQNRDRSDWKKLNQSDDRWSFLINCRNEVPENHAVFAGLEERRSSGTIGDPADPGVSGFRILVSGVVCFDSAALGSGT